MTMNLTTSTASDNTIFDDVYQTIVQKMPTLIIPVINEVFGREYSEEDIPTELRNEHFTLRGKIITDSIFVIRDDCYHIECQSTPDGTIVLRMIAYDFAIAMENVYNEDAPYEVNFPQSCVLYLRHTQNTPDYLELKVNLQDGTSFPYRTRVIKVQTYTKDEIFQKKLLLFLPFYVMRYQQKDKLSKDKDKLQALLKEYEDIRIRLQETLAGKQKEQLYHNLTRLISRIADYIFRDDDETRKEMTKTMGGQPLELFTEQLEREKNEAIEKAVKEAVAEAVAERDATIAEMASTIASLREQLQSV